MKLISVYFDLPWTTTFSFRLTGLFFGDYSRLCQVNSMAGTPEGLRKKKNTWYIIEL